MGYKDFSDSYSFVHDLERPRGKADLAIGKFLENSRSLRRMEEIDKSPIPREEKNTLDCMFRQACAVKCEAYFTGMAFNLSRGVKVLGVT